MSAKHGGLMAESFWEFLKLLREASAVRGRRIVVISGNQIPPCPAAPALEAATAPDFALDFLPPYSPELNPIERVWKLTRRLCLHNRYFGFLETVIEAVESQFSRLGTIQRYSPKIMRNYLRRSV